MLQHRHTVLIHRGWGGGGGGAEEITPGSCVNAVFPPRTIIMSNYQVLHQPMLFAGNGALG